MNKKYIVTLSTTYKDENKGYVDYELKQLRLIKSAERFGIHNLRQWTRKGFLRETFYKENKHLLDIPKGAGLWIWKPYIILKALKSVKQNDFIVYSDTSLHFINEPKALFEQCAANNGFFFLEMDSSWKLSMLCKRDVFHFLGMDDQKHYDAPLTEGYFMIFQKKPETIAFVEKWLNMCLDERLITDDNYSGLEQVANFKDHRCDMPLLSILRLHEGISGFRNPAQWGNHLKMKEFRVNGEFLVNGSYWENEIYTNSPYGTILQYERDGYNCRRPFRHFLKPSFLINKGRKVLKAV